MLVHRDPMGRYSFLNRNDRLDRYLKPRDSRLAVLNVQISDTTQPAPTWNLVELEDKTPSIIKWVCFTFESVPEVTRGSDVAGRLLSQESATQNQASGSEVSSGGRKFLSKEWRHIYFSKRWLKVYGKWPFVCICLLGLVCFA